MAGPAGMRGTRCLCKFWRQTVMWTSISRGGRDFTPRHIWYRDALRHFISGISGESQLQAVALAGRRV